METSRVSIRDVDNVTLTNNIKQAGLSKIITMIIPDYFGNPATLNQWPNSGLYDNLTIYQGVIAVILSIYFFRYTFNLKNRFHLFTCLLPRLIITFDF